MVLALPKVGSVKATKILHSCRISPSKTFGGLSERQRAELAGRLNRSPSDTHIRRKAARVDSLYRESS
jgi:hypothetical protein